MKDDDSDTSLLVGGDRRGVEGDHGSVVGGGGVTVDRTAFGLWFQCLPEGWSAKRLKHLGRLKGGSGFPVQLQGDTESELAFYKVGDLPKSEDGVYLSDPAHTITRPQAKSLGARVFEEGTLVWAKIGAALLLNRRRIVSRPCCIDNNMTGFIPESAVADPKFCYYLTSAIDFSPHVKPGAVPSYSEGDQAELSVPLPPLACQRAIAALLDRETTRIDALIEKKTRFIELLKEKRQALITQAVTKGLDPSVPMKDSGVEWIGEVPEHWGLRRMKHVCDQVIDCKNRTPPEHDGSDYFVVRTSCIKDGTFNAGGGYFTDNKSFIEWTKRSVPQDGDILITREAPMGEVCLAPKGLAFCLGQRMMLYRPAKELLDSEFGLYALQGPLVRDFVAMKSQGSTVGHLRVPDVYNMPILVPPVEEQRIIAGYIAKRENTLTALLKRVVASVELLKERRSALITAAVTGQIDLREAAP